MGSWSTSFITLAAVAVGSLLSFVTTRATDRSRWQREEALRWDTKRLDTYSEFGSALLKFTNIALRISTGLGFPTGIQPLDGEAGLPALAAAGTELNVQWERILLLGSPETVMAAGTWQDGVFHLEYFARQLRSDPAEFAKTRQDVRVARRRFYSAARDDLGITSGDIPDGLQALSKWRTITKPEPQGPTSGPAPEL